LGIEQYEKEYTLADASGRRVHDFARGYQTPKLYQDPLEVYYPVNFFWKDTKSALPVAAIPVAQRKIQVQFARQQELIHRQGSVYKIYRVCQYFVPDRFAKLTDTSNVFEINVPNGGDLVNGEFVGPAYLRTREYMQPVANYGEIKGAKYENVNVGMKVTTVS
jgi:hypothetical protein